MQPGPTMIKKCSVCEKLIEKDTIMSGNGLGAVLWTDGKVEAPMCPETPSLVKCPHCGAFLWINELEEIGMIGDGYFFRENYLFVENEWQEVETFGETLRYKLPNFDEYLALAEKGVETKDKERYIRLHAWWLGNDVRRWTQNKKMCWRQNEEIPISDREASNLEALAKLLDESKPEDILMKAEIMRELGRFNDAIALLAQLKYDEIDSFFQSASIIENLAEKGYVYVCEMEFIR